MTMNPEEAKKITAVMAGSDDNGNKIGLFNGTIKLKLASEGRTRDIGKLKVIKGVLHYVKIMKEKHVFKKTKSWGLNDHVIQSLPEDCVVIISTERKKYQTTVKEVRKHADYLWFKTVGFERQIFMPLSKFE